MIRSLYTAATGMKANQLYVDNISNNLANTSTTAFKKSKIEFEDLIYQTLKEVGQENDSGVISPVGLQIGLGTSAVGNQKIFSQGNFEQTGNLFDLSIEGDGFFMLRRNDGETAYSRNGSLKVTAEGELVSINGFLLEPPVFIPREASNVTIEPDGRLLAMMSIDAENKEEIGQIELARFMNPGGMSAIGGNMYLATPASGLPIIDAPGSGRMGGLRSGFLEASNVVLVEEMVNMIMAQRAYEVSSKAIQASDEMLNTASNLRR